MKRIVVTGLGMINALGLDKESAFSGIIDGKCGITNIESFDTEKHSVKIAGEIKNFDPLTVLDAKEVKKADSAPTTNILSAVPTMILFAASPIACVPAAQAVTEERFGPLSP